MKANNTVLYWSPETGDVELKPLGEKSNLRRSALAAFVDLRSRSFSVRKAQVFVEAMHLIVRDSIDPKVLHSEMLKLEEYRDGCSIDMPNLSKNLSESETERRQWRNGSHPLGYIVVDYLFDHDSIDATNLSTLLSGGETFRAQAPIDAYRKVANDILNMMEKEGILKRVMGNAWKMAETNW